MVQFQRLLSFGVVLTSEETNESANKLVRQFGRSNVAPISEVNCNKNIIDRLMIISDPVIASLIHQPKSQKSELPSYAQRLVLDE